MKIIFILCISFFCIIHDALAVRITYVHTDALGSPVAETDESGNVKWTEHYTPFGKKIDEDPESSENTVGYTGHQFDSDTGLSYMQARYYDPVIGRFYSNDPIGFRDVHSFNRYTYVNNNPYKYTDPTGMLGEGVGCGIAEDCSNSVDSNEGSGGNSNSDAAMGMLSDYFNSSQNVADTANESINKVASSLQDRVSVSVSSTVHTPFGPGGTITGKSDLDLNLSAMVKPSMGAGATFDATFNINILKPDSTSPEVLGRLVFAAGYIAGAKLVFTSNNDGDMGLTISIGSVTGVRVSADYVGTIN